MDAYSFILGKSILITTQTLISKILFDSPKPDMLYGGDLLEFPIEIMASDQPPWANLKRVHLPSAIQPTILAHKPRAIFITHSPTQINFIVHFSAFLIYSYQESSTIVSGRRGINIVFSYFVKSRKLKSGDYMKQLYTVAIKDGLMQQNQKKKRCIYIMVTIVHVRQMYILAYS